MVLILVSRPHVKVLVLILGTRCVGFELESFSKVLKTTATVAVNSFNRRRLQKLHTNVIPKTIQVYVTLWAEPDPCRGPNWWAYGKITI